MAVVVSSEELLEEVIAASGLSGVFAQTNIIRALKRSGVDIATLTRSDVRRALPEIERALSIFMSFEEARAQIARIQKLLGIK